MKFKLNTIKFLAIGFLAVPALMQSCSEDRMDEINQNVNNPGDVQAKFILADVITRTAFSNVGGDFNTYLSSYVEHEVGTHNQLWDAEHRVNQPSLASTFNNTWGNLYTTLRDARIIIDKCSEGGPQSGNNATLGMGQVMAAYNLALLTDMFGDVPFSEAFNPFENKTPKLDKQEELYAQVVAYLDAAIENLPKGDTHGSGNASSHDLLFGGNTSRWIKFAYGLKARYAMRLLNVASNQTAALENVIDFVDQSFANATEAAAFSVYDAQNLNPLFDFQWSRDGLAASRSLGNKLIERNDPRLRRNFTNANWSQVGNIATGNANYNLLAPNGENDQIQYFYLTSTFVFSQTASTQLLSYHELMFLKAEAMQRLGQSSSQIEPVLKAAVVAAIANSELSVEAAFVAPTVAAYGGVSETTADISAEEAGLYFDTTVKPLFTASPLKEIEIQKYLAFSGASGESTEMYNDIRRWKALGESNVVLENSKRFPLRLPYGNSETTTNPNVQQAYGNGQYVYTENVWWAGGTR